MQPLFQNVGIAGVGLIGGSLGWALQKADPRIHIIGIGRDRARLEIALRMKTVCKITTDLSAAAKDCDLIVLATPVERILEMLAEISPYVSPGTVITDVGSTKRMICDEAAKHLPASVEFIGGHPVAGKEVAGVENSSVDLFRNAPYVLCPQAKAGTQNLEKLRQMAESVGARPVIMSADEHDRTMAWLSHVPQLISTALANLGGRERTEISGSGFRDMTRLAASPFSVWKAIVETNSDNIDFALNVLILHLEKMRAGLKGGNFLPEEFERAAQVYAKLRSAKSMINY
jgi:prephenate dehydrogenase